MFLDHPPPRHIDARTLFVKYNLPQTTFIRWKGHLSTYSAYVPTLGHDLSVSGPSTSARRFINLMISNVTDSVMLLISPLHLV